jgi:hypothetical protein
VYKPTFPGSIGVNASFLRVSVLKKQMFDAGLVLICVPVKKRGECYLSVPVSNVRFRCWSSKI